MLTEIITKKQKREFCNFVYKVYQKTPNFRDNFNVTVKDFLWKRTQFTQNCKIFPYSVYKKNKLVARCIFIYHLSIDALQIGFFEALPNEADSVNLLLVKAKEIASNLSLKKILIGLNGHLAYGVGFLKKGHEHINCFDGVYTQPYYINYFRQYKFVEYGLTSYHHDISQIQFPIDKIDDIYKKFSFREIELNDFRRECKILAKLFNETLIHTRYYFQFTEEEVYELLSPLRSLLHSENIIFAVHEGKEIGFIFWHPDYLQVTYSIKNNVLGFLFKYYLRRKQITDIKINAFGVLPEYWRYGLATILCYEVYQRASHYKNLETSFIWDNNVRSFSTSVKLSGKPFKHYVLFEADLEEKIVLKMKIYNSIKDLPDDWDDNLQDNPYLTRSFLSFLEQVDDSPKAYYLFRDTSGKIDSQFIWHLRQNYNISMFTRIKSKIKMNFIYMPLSVARPGIVLGQETFTEALDVIKKIKGWKMVLNLPQKDMLPGFVCGVTCPRCILSLKWQKFDDYLGEMRSSYRRRYRQALKKSSKLTAYFLEDNSAFDHRLYRLYEEVYDRSPYKLEKLQLAFFQGYQFKIMVLEQQGEPCGFIQLLPNGSELIFEFVGFNAKLNHQYDIYIRLLLEIVRYGIDHGFKMIDFGQTADEAKLKLGAKYEKLFAYVHHHNAIQHFILKKTAPYLGYKMLDDSQFHVFKNTNIENNHSK